MNHPGRTTLVKCLVGVLLLLMATAAGSASMVPTDDDSDPLFCWVSNSRAKTVSLIDLNTLTVRETFRVEREPRGIDGNLVGAAIVANYGSKSISLIDVAELQVDHLAVDHRVADVGMGPTGENIVLVLPETDSIELFDGDTLNSMEVGRRPLAVALPRDGRGRLAVANSLSDSVSLIPFQDLAVGRRNARTQVIQVGREPRELAFDAKGRTLVVSNFKSGTVSVIDVKTAIVIDTLEVGRSPWGVDITSSSPPVVVVANFKSNSVSLLEGGKRIDVRVGKRPIGLAVTPDGKLALVANSKSNTVSVIDIGAAAVVATIPVGKGPYGVSIGPSATDPPPPPPDFSMITPYVNKSDIPRVEPFVTAEGVSGSPTGWVHEGLDFGIDATDVPIRVAASGMVEIVELSKNAENWQVSVLIVVTEDTSLIYGFEPFSSKKSDGQAQLDNILVSVGDEVTRGQELGRLLWGGEGAHLHFAVGQKTGNVCPEAFFTRQARRSVMRLLKKTWGPGTEMCY